VRVPGLADRSGVAGHGSDTGGEVGGSAAAGHPGSRQRAGTVAEASPPAADDREQMANSEFATSVGSFDGQASCAELLSYRATLLGYVLVRQ